MESNDRHNYEYDVDLKGGSAPARVVRMVGEGKRVLEVGAGPGSISKMLKGVSDCRVTGLEIDDEAIVKLKKYCERVYKTDLNNPLWPEKLSAEKQFDVVLAADVLEHIYDPVAVLKAMAGIAGQTGEVIVSLPHVGHNSVIACLLDEDFHYQDWGLLDRTHIRFFGLKNMQQLFNDAGLKIIEAQFVITQPEDSEFATKWNALQRDTKLVLTKHKYGLVYQVVIRAVLSTHDAVEVDLMSIPVEKLPNTWLDGGLGIFVRRVARQLISEKIRERIRKYY